MSELFLKIIVMSISASWLVLAVLILRLVLKKAPKWLNVLLWGIVAIRLICPFTIESPVSMIPDSVGSGKFVSEWMDDYVGNVDIHHSDSVYYDAAIGAGREPISDGEGGYYVVTKHDQLGEPATIKNTVVPVLSVMWVTGITVLAFYTVISFWRLRRKVNEAVIFRENIYLNENVCSPFVLGIIKPKIYLPFKMDDQNLEHIIAHEKAHIRRKDHWWKPFGFLLLTLHWFNPLMWIAYVLLCRDIELACDEKVIKELGNEQRADYTQALLACSVNRRMIAACPLAFGEIGVKERVKNVLNYKKPAFWVIVVAVIACAVVTVCFATNPKQDFSQEQRTVQAQITEVEDGSFLVTPVEGTWELSSSNLFRVPITNMPPSPEPRVGDVIEITYDGSILESDPAQFGTIYSMRVVSQAGRLTLDDVVTLAQKGDALTWSDFEPYQGREVGSGLYIMRYEIDELFDVLVGGVPEETPMYIRLRNQNINAWVDLQEDGVERVKAFIEEYKNDVPKVDELSAALNKLEYQPFTCDGLPEYKLYDTDGTVYSINFSEKWVWRGNSEQAELSDELIRLLRESGVLVAGEDTPTPAGPDAAAATLSEEQTAIRQAILEHNKSSYPLEYDVACCSFITLETLSATPLAGSGTHKITYYGWALYEQYRATDNGLEATGGSHIPVALSFDLDEHGYTLTEYWEPRDGSYYVQDIREKFPAHIVEDGMDSQKFILQQTQECYAQAVAATGLDTNKVIGSLIETICSSPALSSNPGDYIKEHSIEYRALTYYGRYTLKYCFTEFLKGEQTDLRGHIMRAAMDDIAPESQLKLDAETGQEYFDAWKDAAISVGKQHDMEWIETHQPAIYLLLQMIDE